MDFEKSPSLTSFPNHSAQSSLSEMVPFEILACVSGEKHDLYDTLSMDVEMLMCASAILRFGIKSKFLTQEKRVFEITFSLEFFDFFS